MAHIQTVHTQITKPKTLYTNKCTVLNSNKSKIFYKSIQGGNSFVDLFMCFFCLVFAMPLCVSVYMCLVVTCWERADLLALVCGV